MMSDDRRALPRQRVLKSGMLVGPNLRTTAACTVRNLSKNGGSEEKRKVIERAVKVNALQEYQESSAGCQPSGPLGSRSRKCQTKQ